MFLLLKKMAAMHYLLALVALAAFVSGELAVLRQVAAKIDAKIPAERTLKFPDEYKGILPLILPAALNTYVKRPAESNKFSQEPLSKDLEAFLPILDSMIQSGALCTACEQAIEFLYNVTTNEEVLEELVGLLLPLCDYVPYFLHDVCLYEIHSIPARVDEFAKATLDPDVDCHKICYPIDTADVASNLH